MANALPPGGEPSFMEDGRLAQVWNAEVRGGAPGSPRGARPQQAVLRLRGEVTGCGMPGRDLN